MKSEGMGPQTRIARAEDTPELAALCEQLGYPASGEVVAVRLVDLLADRHHTVIVAEAPSGHVVGWVHAFVRSLLIAPAHVEIGGLVVEGNHRCQGTGRLLMGAVERWAGRCGCETISVRSNVVRQDAHAFYERLGYTNIKTSLTYRKGL